MFFALFIGLWGCSHKISPPQRGSVEAVRATIDLIPVEVYIPSTQDYIFLGKCKDEYFLFKTKDKRLANALRNKPKDSSIVLDGTPFSPLQLYSDRQWRNLSKEIKKTFPLENHRELEHYPFYLIFNWSFVPAGTSSDLQKYEYIITPPAKQNPPPGVDPG